MTTIVDPKGKYTGLSQLYPDDDPFATVAALENDRPWTGMTMQPSAPNHKLTWVSQPGSTRFPGFGVPGPDCRRGHGTVSYLYDEQHTYPRLAATHDTLSTFGTLPRTSTFNGSLRSLSSSPSMRSLRLEAAAAARPMSALIRPQRAVPEPPKLRQVPIWNGSKFRKDPTAPRFETAPGLGYGSKFIYRF